MFRHKHLAHCLGNWCSLFRNTVLGARSTTTNVVLATNNFASVYFSMQKISHTKLRSRPQHIILFFLPIILFSNSQDNLSFFFSFWNLLIQNTIIVHAVCKYSVSALCGIWLSPESSKVSMLSCDSCPSIAHYAQLSQICLHVAVNSNFEPQLSKFNPIIPELFFFYKPTHYSRRNSQIICWGLLGRCQASLQVSTICRAWFSKGHMASDEWLQYQCLIKTCMSWYVPISIKRADCRPKGRWHVLEDKSLWTATRKEHQTSVSILCQITF